MQVRFFGILGMITMVRSIFVLVLFMVRFEYCWSALEAFHFLECVYNLGRQDAERGAFYTFFWWYGEHMKSCLKKINLFSYNRSGRGLPLGYHWCPFGGFTQLASLIEDIESQPNSYHEPLGSSAFGDRSSSSGSAHVCPYLASHGFPRPMHTAPSSSSDHVPENSHFHRHSIALGGQPPAEMLNLHSFTSAEPTNHNWQQQPSPLSMPPLAANSDHQYGLRLPRTDTGNHQSRQGSFVHPHPHPHGSVPARSASSLAAGSMAPSVLGEVRTHTSRSSPFIPIRRSRPRGLTLVSTSNSTDIGGLYGLSVSSSSGRSLQDSGRQFERVYGWGREGFNPLPWIPVNGESRWWGPFNPNQAPQPGTFHQRGGAANERAAQGRSENGYHHRMPPPPPYM